MKRAKKLYGLLGALLLLCIVTFLIYQYEEKKEVIKNSDEVILEIPVDKVTALSWDYQDVDLAFHKDDQWIYDKDDNFPVDEEKINHLLKVFENLGASFIIEEVKDYEPYGLDQPVANIHIKTEDTSYEIKVGGYSTMDSKRYVSIDDGNVYLLGTDPMEYYDVELKDMIKHDEIPDFDQVKDIQFTGITEDQINYVEDSKNTYNSEDVYFTNRDSKDLPLDTEQVSSYLNKLSNLNPTTYVVYHLEDTDLKTYGLKQPDLTLTVNYKESNEKDKSESDNTFTLSVGRNPEEVKKASEDELENLKGYVRIGESNIIYEITAQQYKNLTSVTYNDLRHQDLFYGKFDQINQIDFTIDGSQYSITTKEEDGAKAYYYLEEKIEIEDIKNAFLALTAAEFTEEKAIKKEEIGVVLHLDNESFPTIEINLYRHNGSQCIATVEDEIVSFIERSKVIDLVESVYGVVLN